MSTTAHAATAGSVGAESTMSDSAKCGGCCGFWVSFLGLRDSLGSSSLSVNLTPLPSPPSPSPPLPLPLFKAATETVEAVAARARRTCASRPRPFALLLGASVASVLPRLFSFPSLIPPPSSCSPSPYSLPSLSRSGPNFGGYGGFYGVPFGLGELSSYAECGWDSNGWNGWSESRSKEKEEKGFGVVGWHVFGSLKLTHLTPNPPPPPTPTPTPRTPFLSLARRALGQRAGMLLQARLLLRRRRLRLRWRVRQVRLEPLPQHLRPRRNLRRRR